MVQLMNENRCGICQAAKLRHRNPRWRPMDSEAYFGSKLEMKDNEYRLLFRSIRHIYLVVVYKV